jgi:hypothetical protein
MYPFLCRVCLKKAGYEEEQVYGRADYWYFEGAGGWFSNFGCLQAAWDQPCDIL